MSRDGFGVYSPPAGTLATPGTAIESAKYNAFVNDLTNDANTARPIVAGGTGATTASAALAALGGQPVDAGLTDIAALAVTDGNFIVGNGTNWVSESGATARASLGLTIGTDVQAYNASLASLSGLTLAAGDLLYATAADTLVNLAKGTAFQSLKMNSGATAPEWVGISQSALTSTASGGPYLVTIPAGVRKIEVIFDKISLDSTGHWFVQIGPSSGVVTTGYEAGSGNRSTDLGVITNGFPIFSGSAVRQMTGTMTLVLMDSATNLWVASSTLTDTNSGVQFFGSGRIALSGTLERFRLTFTTANNPDGGQFRVQWE